MGAGPVLCPQRPRPWRDHPGMRDGRVQQHAGRHGARLGEHRVLRPAEPHLAVRRLHRHRRSRPGHRRLGRAAHGRGRRLRCPDQPDDRRRPDHGRADRGVRDVQHAVHHVRRRRQLRRLELHGLPAAERLGDPRLRAAQRGRHAVPAPPDRRQGHRRVPAVGGPAAFVNAVIDALGGTGVRNIDMPVLPDRVWEAITYRRDVSGAPPVRQDG